jgi:hypothetical protein
MSRWITVVFPPLLAVLTLAGCDGATPREDGTETWQDVWETPPDVPGAPGSIRESVDAPPRPTLGDTAAASANDTAAQAPADTMPPGARRGS